MQNNTPDTAGPPRKPKRACCTDTACDTGLRNQYFEGKRLTADGFQVEQRYSLERRRLLNRALHGWGVVYGYAVQGAAARAGQGPDSCARLQIGPGLALDECGRELLQTGITLLEVEDAILFDGDGRCIERPPPGSYQMRARDGDARQAASQWAPQNGWQNGPQNGPQGGQQCWLLSVHYAEQELGPLTVGDPCDCERKQWDRLCETVRYSLRQVDCNACCVPDDCELSCGCASGPCCGGTDIEEGGEQGVEHGGQHPHRQPAPERRAGRGACQCLCAHLTGLSDSPCGELRPLADPCASMRADLCHGVPLACVRLREGGCDGQWCFDPWIEACGPRRLVKSNEVLFDLLRGCDLTRISAIGWPGWHRSRRLIDWDSFEASFGVLADSDLERMRKSRDRREMFPVLTARYWVEFSRPVRRATVRADCFAITVLGAEEEGGWGGSYRVPILRAETWAAPGTAAGLVSRATLVVDGRWLYDGIKGSKTMFDKDPITVEIAIRGDLIVDCNGQAVDANAHGLSPAPSGNGTPGGTFFSTFQVQPRFAEYRLADGAVTRAEGAQS